MLHKIIKIIAKYSGLLFYYKKLINPARTSKISFWWLLIANLRSPSRTLARLKHNKSKRFGLTTRFKTTSNDNIQTNIKFDSENISESFNKAELALRTHGAVVIENYFNPLLLSKFFNQYQNSIDKLKSTGSAYSGPLILTHELLNLWLDKELYGFLRKYFGTSVYCRSYPRIQYVDNNVTPETIKTNPVIAEEWHIDHCSIMNQFVYLQPREAGGTCMEIVSGSHRLPNVCVSAYSDEYIKECGLSTLKLRGPLGSVQLHDPNVIHRTHTVYGSDRLSFYNEFSWGENIITNLNDIVKMLSESEISIDQLPDFQKDALVGIFPLTPKKGYEIKGGFIRPQIRQSI